MWCVSLDVENEAGLLPKISARRCWLFGVTCPLTTGAGGTTSSPRRSTSFPPCVDPTGLFSLTARNIRFSHKPNTSIHTPTPITVALSSGGGIRSRTPLFRSPKVNKLANSTARCCSSSSGLVVYLARTSAILCCCGELIVGLEANLVILVRRNWRVREFA